MSISPPPHTFVTCSSVSVKTYPAVGLKVPCVQMCWEMLGVWRQPAALLQAGMGTEAVSLTAANRLLSQP